MQCNSCFPSLIPEMLLVIGNEKVSSDADYRRPWRRLSLPTEPAWPTVQPAIVWPPNPQTNWNMRRSTCPPLLSNAPAAAQTRSAANSRGPGGQWRAAQFACPSL